MTSLAQYDRARAALAEATSIDEVLPLRAQMEHIKLHARHVQDRALMADATEIQIRAERKLGFLLGEAKKAGLLKASRPKKPDPEKPADTEGFTLKEIGVTEKLSSMAQKKASITEQALETMISGIRGRIISGKAKIIDAEPLNGARAIMGSRQEPDDSLDYFPTPPWATRALVEYALPEIGVTGRELGSVWEPACGEGHIAEVLREYSTKVIATDIHDYGQGEVADFLTFGGPVGADWIITNPPFGDEAIKFVHRALELAQIGVAMFFRSQWAVEGIERYEAIFKHNPPTLCAFFVERVNLCKGRWDPDGTTATAYCWLIWKKGETPRPPFWIPPGCRKSLTMEGDREKFAPWSIGAPAADHDSETGEIIDGQTSEPVVTDDASQDHSAVVNSESPLDIPQFLDRTRKAEATA